MLFIAQAQSPQNFDSFLNTGFIDINRREASLQGGVLLNVLAVFVQSGRADTLQFAPG